jgi:hypothetical protein
MSWDDAVQRMRSPSRLTVVTLIAVLLAPIHAMAQFAVAGKPIPPAESNFAGVRQVTPRYGLIVQINHDVRPQGDFDLGLVDEVYASLLRDARRGPVIRADALPIVVTTQAKIARFGEGGRRRMFRFLEPELRTQQDVHLSPTAVFVSSEPLGDVEKLRAMLRRALTFHFDERFRQAIESMDRPLPDRP